MITVILGLVISVILKGEQLIDIFTDGAVKYGNIGWGFVVVDQGIGIDREFGSVKGPDSLLRQRNITGELVAVKEAISWAIDRGFYSIRIVYDYSGVSEWPARHWMAKNKHTKDYVNFIDSCREVISIRFYLVKGHGRNELDYDNKWNDVADVLAKAGAVKSYEENDRQKISFK